MNFPRNALTILLCGFILLPYMLRAEAFEGIHQTINRVIVLGLSLLFFIVQLLTYFNKKSTPGNKGSFFLVPIALVIIFLALHMYADYSEEYNYEKSMWADNLTNPMSPADLQETLDYKNGIQQNYFLTIGYISVISIFALFSAAHGIMIDSRHKKNNNDNTLPK